MTQKNRSVMALAVMALTSLWPGLTLAADAGAFSGPAFGPVPVEFVMFACVLAGVAFFHQYTLRIAITRR